MPFLIGTDEAGYGPNLGPLLVSATLWEIEDFSPDQDLYERFAPTIVRTPVPAKQTERVAICDSKQLYSSSSSLVGLERGLLSLLRLVGKPIESWRECWQTLAPDSREFLEQLPWYSGFERSLPRDTDPLVIQQLSQNIGACLQQSKTKLLDIRSQAVFPEPFNEQSDLLGSKGALLSRVTIGLVMDLLKQTAGRPTFVLCDKHGGRNRYSQILQQFLVDTLIEIHGETRQQSIYRWGPAGQRVEMRFVAKGESFMPSAVASMASKYLRELAMEAFNDYWCEEVQGIRRTAGYPVDAKRFKAQIESRQKELAIDDRILWRTR